MILFKTYCVVINLEAKLLEEMYHIDKETGFLCRYVRSDTERFKPHYHDYFEVFLMCRGKAMHLINGQERNLYPGDLLFIRDFDIHDYASINGEYFEFINLAFSKETFKLMSDYLGEGFSFEGLLHSPTPPKAVLNKREKEKLFFKMTDTPQKSDKSTVKLKYRILLADIFTTYFLNFQDFESDIPAWLEITVEKMKSPPNFIEGVTKMYEISGKSREHLSRSLKKFYGISPTDFINDLRLEYCANLLIASNLNVTDIAFECGFENISWFYKAFLRKFGVTPFKYRKELKMM